MGVGMISFPSASLMQQILEGPKTHGGGHGGGGHAGGGFSELITGQQASQVAAATTQPLRPRTVVTAKPAPKADPRDRQTDNEPEEGFEDEDLREAHARSQRLIRQTWA
jgi:hypothetical protein